MQVLRILLFRRSILKDSSLMGSNPSPVKHR